ncbi:MAG TPA: ABC transporter ATP-binding protein [Pseudonocardiaceae bacterium]|jgi:branched-chain amino acid transport system ATP-binding protein|nr:ABC transporter ATP-binding protein [Pseudonocardiaceae bacterium]
MTGAPLALERVGKRFGRVTVAEQLSLTVGAGELLGIVGPNGAGKTTLFAMISGDVRPDSGEITLDGRPITTLAPAARTRLGIGRTYQVPRPFEHMTVFENVLTGAVHGARLGRAPAREEALRCLALTDLLGFANQPAGRLNLLARKRLEVARALATAPRLLLLDEVAGGLTDPEVDELLEIVGTLRAEGLTVLWIEHVVHALLRSVDRLVCLAAGALIADGEPAAVMADRTVREVYLGASVRGVPT